MLVLLFIACGFFVDKLNTIFNITMPFFSREKSKINQKKYAKVFEHAYNWVQDRLVERLCTYSELWLKSKRWKNYKEQEIHIM